MDFFQFVSLAGIVISIIAFLISLWRFKEEIKVIGPDIRMLMRDNFQIDAHHASLRERELWGYQFDLIFHNQGDKNGLVIITGIESEPFETIALWKDGMRHERQYPLAIPIRDGEIEKVAFHGNVYSFEGEMLNDELIISVDLFKKSRSHFWEEYELYSSSKTYRQEIALLKPKRAKEGTDERRKKIKEQAK